MEQPINVNREVVKPTARAFDKKVERVVAEFKPMVEIIITHADAIVLQKILCNIAGSPEGPRGVADRISTALDDLGIRSLWNDQRFSIRGELHIEAGPKHV